MNQTIDTMEPAVQRMKELELRKAEIEDWFWQFPDSPNESAMKNEYMLVLGEIEELKSKSNIDE